MRRAHGASQVLRVVVCRSHALSGSPAATGHFTGQNNRIGHAELHHMFGHATHLFSTVGTLQHSRNVSRSRARTGEEWLHRLEDVGQRRSVASRRSRWRSTPSWPQNTPSSDMWTTPLQGLPDTAPAMASITAYLTENWSVTSIT